MKPGDPAKHKGILPRANLKLGSVKEPACGRVRILFAFSSQGFEYLGQALAGSGGVKVEMFNPGFFSLFPEGKSAIEVELRTLILKELAGSANVEETVRSLAESLLQAETPEPLALKPESRSGADEVDLVEIFDRLNRDYFGGKVKADIQWGNRYGKNNRRSIRYGSYDDRVKMIRVNPVLARPDVPREALEMTVYHEMCHQAFPPIRKSGRWQVHHGAFKKKEREYPHYEEVARWERANWTRLLES